VLRARRKSFVLLAQLAHSSCALPRMDFTPSKSTAQKRVSQCEIDYGLMSGTCTSSTSIARPRRQSS